jgi:hypothetical protein
MTMQNDLRESAQQMTDQQLRRVVDNHNGAIGPAPGPGGAVSEGDPLAPYAQEELLRREPLYDPYLDE